MHSTRDSARVLIAGLTLASMMLVGLPLQAEVAAEPKLNEVGILILGVIEGPDPIPQVIWEPIRDIDPALILNGEGAPRGDGRPDVSIDPVTGVPHVVWAYNNGNDFDIAYSVWADDAWSETDFLTFNTENQIDPRIYAGEQAVYVVWWEAPAGSIWFSKKPRMGLWTVPEQVVTTQVASRPSVISWEGELLFAAERGDGDEHEIFLSTRLGPSNYVSESVALLSTSHALDAVLHGEEHKLWVDWCQSPTVCAYSIREGESWSEPIEVPAVGPNWVELEATRLIMRKLVILTP